MENLNNFYSDSCFESDGYLCFGSVGQTAASCHVWMSKTNRFFPKDTFFSVTHILFTFQLNIARILKRM